MRAPDGWDSPRFQAFSWALAVFPFRALFAPAAGNAHRLAACLHGLIGIGQCYQSELIWSDTCNLKQERLFSSTMASKKHFLMYYVFGAVLFTMMIMFLSTPQSAWACEPTLAPPGYIPPTPIPIETQVTSVIHDAQLVLDGKLESWVESTNGNSVLTVHVERYLKGQGPKTVKISGYFWDCPPNFALQQGSRYTFFVNGDPTATEPLQVRGWFVSHEAIAASVGNSTGQEPTTPYGAYNVVWLSLLAIIGLGLILFIHYHRTRL